MLKLLTTTSAKLQCADAARIVDEMGKENKKDYHHCSACPASFFGRPKYLPLEMRDSSSSGPDADVLCPNCYWDVLHKAGSVADKHCGVCPAHGRELKLYRIHDRFRPFLPPQDHPPLFFCKACYDRALRASRKGRGGADRDSSACDSDQHFSEIHSTLRPVSSVHGGQITAMLQLRDAIVGLARVRTARSPLEDTEAYRNAVNAASGGLFDLIVSVLPPNISDVEDKVTMWLQQLVHLIDPAQSSAQWELSDFLYQSGVSDRARRALYRKGYGMHPSKQIEHMIRCIEAHHTSVLAAVQDGCHTFMLVVDDFHAIWASRVPKKNGRFSTAGHVANAIMKNLSQLGIDLRVEIYPECLTPSVFPIAAVEGWIRRVWEECGGCTYASKREQCLLRIASSLQPYGHSGTGAEWDNPIDMRKVTLLESFSSNFSSEAQCAAVIDGIVGRLIAILPRQHIILTGDFYPFWYLLRLVRRNPAKYGHLIPIPGAFHVGLNAQEAIFLHYRPVLEKLYRAMFPGRNFPVYPTAMERKFVLEVIALGWKRCRGECLRRLALLDSIPLDAVVLVQLLDEFVPVALDVYAVFLSGNFQKYESILLRSLVMFLQLGKRNYVRCLSIFIGQLLHWQEKYPALYASLTENLRFLSEEEVEIFHSTIRARIIGPKDSEHLARFVNFCGARADMMQRWKGEPSESEGKQSWMRDVDCFAAKSAAAVKALFNATILVDTPCHKTEGAAWQSAVLGTIGDHCLPYALQLARIRVRGCTGNIHAHRVVCDGYLDSRAQRLCGHRRTRDRCCSECEAAVTQIATELLLKPILR